MSLEPGVEDGLEPMSREEVQRSVQQLLDRQARSGADFEALSQKTDQLTDGLIGLTSLVRRVVDNVDRLADPSARTPQQVSEAHEQVRELGRLVAQADAQLGAVLDTFAAALGPVTRPAAG